MNENPDQAADAASIEVPADTSLAEVLSDLAARGFAGSFEVDADSGACRCAACDTSTAPGDVEVADSRRLEGASDPAEMSSVLAVRCPACGHRGVAVVRFGPEASVGEAALLRATKGATRS